MDRETIIHRSLRFLKYHPKQPYQKIWTTTENGNIEHEDVNAN